MIKLTKVTVPPSDRNKRWNKFIKQKRKCFVLHESETKKTVLMPTDKTMEYFHLIIIEDGKVTPLTSPISRLELSDQFQF